MISPTALETRLRLCEAGLAEIRYRAGVIERELETLREAGAHSVDEVPAEWRCEHCGEANDPEFRACRYCRREREAPAEEPSLFESTEPTS